MRNFNPEKWGAVWMKKKIKYTMNLINAVCNCDEYRMELSGIGQVILQQ